MYAQTHNMSEKYVISTVAIGYSCHKKLPPATNTRIDLNQSRTPCKSARHNCRLSLLNLDDIYGSDLVCRRILPFVRFSADSDRHAGVATPRVCGRNNGGTRQGLSTALKALLFFEAHNVSDDVVFRLGLENEIRHSTMREKNIIVVMPGVDATAEKLGASELGD
jgi:hypothetical protein